MTQKFKSLPSFTTMSQKPFSLLRFSNLHRSSTDLTPHLENFKSALLSINSLGEYIAQLHNLVSNALDISYSIFFYQDGNSNSYIGFHTADNARLQVEFSQDSPFIQLISKKYRPFYLFGDETLPKLSQHDRAKLTLLQMLVCVPIHLANHLIGFIGVGKPENRSRFSTEELMFLEDVSQLSAILINHLIEKNEINQKIREMDTLNRLAQGINITLHFDDLMEMIYAQTSNVLPLTDYWITLVDTKTRKFSRIFYIENNERCFEKELSPFSPEICLEKDTILSQKAILTEDYLQTARLAGVNLGKTEIQSWMSVPLISGKDTIGALCIGHRSMDVHYTTQHQFLLRAIADQTAAAITKTRLLHETQVHAQRLTILNEIARNLTASLELNPLLDLVRESGQKLIACEEWIVWIYDETTGELTQQFSTQNQELQLDPTVISWIQRSLETKSPLIENDSSSDTENHYLILPLVIENKRIGVIALINKTDNSPFTREDLDLISTFGNQVAIALDNAMKYMQTDQALQARLQELSALQRIDQELNATLNIHNALEITLRWAMQNSNADAGIIGLLNEQEFQPIHNYGYAQSFTSHDFSEIVPSLQNFKGEQFLIHSLFLEDGIASMIFPIEREGIVIAAIILESKKSGFCPADTRNFLSRLCAHSAIALSNALLYSEVQQANLAKSEFVSLVSHELKTPMTAIKGYADLIAQGAVGPINEIQANFLTTIRANVNRMATLVSDLADISRIEAGKLHLEYQAVSIPEILQEVIRTVSTQSEEKSQTIKLDIPEDLPLVWADRNRLIQIYNNLISNAIKYSPPNSSIEVCCSIAENQDDSPTGLKFVLSSVKDHGYGIAEQDKTKIFQKFFRSEDVHIRENPGTGLGLNITKYLVEIQGGKIWFESSLGVGTTFFFLIPLASMDDR